MPAHNPNELLQQFHDNQSSWIARLSTGQTRPWRLHDRVLIVGDTQAMRPGAAGVIMLPMGGDPARTIADHNRALAWMQQSRTRDVLVWSMQPNPDLDLALLAQGYAPGFEPWWMTRDLTTPFPAPTHAVRPVNALDIEQLIESDVPYVIEDQVPAIRALISDATGPQVQWLVAIVDDEPVGHAIVNLLDQHAGLFNVGVSGRYRHRGIGTSLTVAAMQAARDRGALTMNLNSTIIAKGMYEHAGFVQFGVGQTWTRSGQAVYQIPTPSEHELAIALGQGDTANVRFDPLLVFPLACGLTPQEFAARFGQREMLLHLIREGFVPDIISLWQVGLRDEAISAVHHPQAREMISGSRRAHPIHHAIERGAGTLVMELIAAGADLNSRDGDYNATPLDWAHACNKPTIARIIRQAGGS